MPHAKSSSALVELDSTTSTSSIFGRKKRGSIIVISDDPLKSFREEQITSNISNDIIVEGEEEAEAIVPIEMKARSKSIDNLGTKSELTKSRKSIVDFANEGLPRSMSTLLSVKRTKVELKGKSEGIYGGMLTVDDVDGCFVKLGESGMIISHPSRTWNDVDLKGSVATPCRISTKFVFFVDTSSAKYSMTALTYQKMVMRQFNVRSNGWQLLIRFHRAYKLK